MMVQDSAESMSEPEMSAYEEAANARLSTWESLTAAYRERSNLLRSARDAVASGYAELRRERERLSEENGGSDVSDADLIEINAGGKVIAAARGALTRLKGTGLEALFSGRWEDKILRDELGRVFLDVNPKPLRSIVDYLHDLGISSPDSAVSPPFADEDNRIFLDHLMSLFGLPLGTAGQRNVTPEADVSYTKEDWELVTFSEFPTNLKKDFQREQAQLRRAKLKLKKEQRAFQQEKDFIKLFLKDNEDVDGIVHLNVSGVPMSVKRSTLGLCEDSVLAKQFNDPKWRDSGGKNKVATAQNWDADQVVKWAKGMTGVVPDDVSMILEAQAVTGSELLAMRRPDLSNLGITRAGTVALLMSGIDDLKKLQIKSCQVLISHSPYCFGKIVDQLRLRRLLRRSDDPQMPPPHIRAEEEMRFKKVVEYYFPGEEASSFVLSGYQFSAGPGSIPRADAPERSGRSAGSFSLKRPADPPAPAPASGFSFSRVPDTPVPAPAPRNEGGFSFGVPPAARPVRAPSNQRGFSFGSPASAPSDGARPPAAGGQGPHSATSLIF